MELNNDFRVSAPPPKAWKVLTDVERIAPMLPGAKLEEIEGDEFRGLVKVKVGPITAQYKGKATFAEQNESEGRVVLKATGRDTRGAGNANATITATLTPDGDGTKVNVLTDLTVTGKVAQFGRGVLADVSAKLIGQFVDALEADLGKDDSAPSAAASSTAAPSTAAPAGPSAAASSTASAPSAPAPSEESAAKAGSDENGVVDGGGAGTPPAAEPSRIRTIESADPEPVNLLDAAGGSVTKRLVPVIAGLGLLGVVLAILRSRRK